MARRLTPEGYVKNAVQDFLTVRRIHWERRNTGTQILVSEKTGKKRAVSFGTRGMADLLAYVPWCHGGFMLLWIETKAGTKQRPHQAEFEKSMIELGHEYILARSVDDVEWALGELEKMKAQKTGQA